MKPASYFETYRKQMPVVERYTYLNSAGCGPYPQSVWDSMRGVFEYIFDEGQINVQVHDRLFEMLEEARPGCSPLYPCRAGGDLLCALYCRRLQYH